jgi:hypothetical protein
MDESLYETPPSRPAGKGVDLFFADAEEQPSSETPMTSADLGLDQPSPPAVEGPEEAAAAKTMAHQANGSHTDHVDDVAAAAADAFAVEEVLQESYTITADTALPEAAVLSELAEPAAETKGTTAEVAAAATAAKVEDLPRIDRPAPSLAAAGAASVPPPAPAKPAASGSRSGGCLRTLGLLLLATLLGAALALALMFVINGNLRWASPQEVVALKNNVAALQRTSQALDGQLAALQGNLVGTRSDLSNLQDGLDNLGSDVTAIQDNVAVLPALQENLAAAQNKVAGLETMSAAMAATMATVQQDVGALTERVGQVAASAERSDTFLTGMRNVLNSIYGEAPATTAVTSTELLTPTVPLTVTETITAGAMLTPTLPVTATPELESAPVVTATTEISGTPTVTATIAITATPTVTATAAPAGAATPIPSSAQPNIRGAVFIDANRNGRLDIGELGLAGVRLALRMPNQTELQVATTDLQGAYAFYDLPPGRYVVVQSDAQGFGSTTPNAVTVIVRGAAPATVDFGDYRLGQ